MGTILLWSLYERPSIASRIEESFQHFWRAVTVTDREKRL